MTFHNTDANLLFNKAVAEKVNLSSKVIDNRSIHLVDRIAVMGNKSAMR